jgi:hypothetical protein
MGGDKRRSDRNGQHHGRIAESTSLEKLFARLWSPCGHAHRQTTHDFWVMRLKETLSGRSAMVSGRKVVLKRCAKKQRSHS